MDWLKGILVIGAVIALEASGYKIGIGIADMTGPVAEVAFMGYAHPDQRGQGLHMRQFARSFIIDDGDNRIVFVSADCGMMGTGVRKEVLKVLANDLGDLYTDQNVMISGTHTHSTPGGFLMDIIFDLNTFGFVQETFDAYTNGILRSILRAHDNMVEGNLYISRGEILDVNINRSPTAYLLNPKDERDYYEYNVDKTFTQLKFKDVKGQPLGVITWYAVHATSMNNTNKLVSSDNVGFAARLFEKNMEKGFVAAFASSNLGDVSPNIKGPLCVPSGKPCDNERSTCVDSGDSCIASGPGDNMFESTSIIAHRLFEAAQDAFYNGEEEFVKGPVKTVHQYVHMPSQVTNYTDPNTFETRTVKGCLPAMGYSFAAGTTDGPGAFSFKQSTKTTNPLWNALTDLIAPPTKEQVECQAPKPILISTGEMNFPFEWQPSVVSTQLALVGSLAIACVPGEFTTMSGRRMRNALSDVLYGKTRPSVVISGLCNTYSDYIATPEEYKAQRYEGASTIFGPQTLPLYIEQYKKLARNLLKGQKTDPGPEPVMNRNNLISLLPGVVFDNPGWRKNFGDVLRQPPGAVKYGDVVCVQFVGANPRNGLMQESTYLTVEFFDGKEWTVVATDADWETKFIWRRTSTMLGTSVVEIRWEVPTLIKTGAYRIRHFGHFKYIYGKIERYEGTTRTFQVL